MLGRSWALVACRQVGDKNLAQLRELNALFQHLDKDGDGTVDAEEVSAGTIRPQNTLKAKFSDATR